jgi:hypothetical protein
MNKTLGENVPMALYFLYLKRKVSSPDAYGRLGPEELSLMPGLGIA